MDVKNPHLMYPTNHVRVLEAGSGNKASLVYSETTGSVSASLVTKDGYSKAIAAENCPKEFDLIKNLDSFNGFVQNAHARVAIMSDGEPKLYVMQKGLGGSGLGGFNPVGPHGPNCPPGHGTNGIMNWQPNNVHQGYQNPAPSIGLHGSAHSIGGGTTIGSATFAVTQHIANGQKPSTSFGVGFRFNK